MIAPSRLLSLFGGSLILALCGCGAGAPTVTTLPAINGSVMGGSQLLGYSSVQLWAAGTNGYGGASVALLSPVTADGLGSFSISGMYTCPSASSQVYLTATGGNPGLAGGSSVSNPNIALMAALGSCGSLSASTHITINEVTTIAASYALAGFATSYDHIGTSATNSAGLMNAFRMSGNLANFDTGQSLATGPAGATVPVAEIYTLADALASCVNSTGGAAGSSTTCGTLFTAATPSGGTAPTNTADAAINIAHYPGKNVSAIYSLSTASSPFQPTLSSAPNDWTMAIGISSGGTQGVRGISLDSTGNAYVIDPTALHLINPAGQVTNNFPAMAGYSVAMDLTDNPWVGGTGPVGQQGKVMHMVNFGTPSVYSDGLSTSGTADVISMAVDGFGNAWYTCSYCSTAGKMTNSGTFVGAYAPNSDFHGTSVALDPSENIWLSSLVSLSTATNSGTARTSPSCGSNSCGDPEFIAFDSTGVAWVAASSSLLSVSLGGSVTSYSVFNGSHSDLYAPYATAIDGGNHVWVVNSQNTSNQYTGALAELTTAGVSLSPTLGYVSNTMAVATKIAIDGSGNVWTGNSTTPTLSIWVGAAVPVGPSLSQNLKNGTVGTRP